MSGAVHLEIDVLVAVLVLAVLQWSGRPAALLADRVGARFGQVAQGCLLAYVVVDLLPEVAAAEAEFEESVTGHLPLAEPAWLACLAGMLVLTAVEGTRWRRRRHPTAAEVDGAFVLTLGAGVATNLNVGVLLVHHHRDGALAVAGLAGLLAVHHALEDREHVSHSQAGAYRRWGRPALASALVIGLLAGSTWHPGGAGLALLRAGLAGLLALNVLQHHLREEDVARAPAFVAGSTFYGLGLCLV